MAFRDRLKMFPGKLAPKAAVFAGNATKGADGRTTSDKTKDAESLAIYAAGHPASVQSWKRYVEHEKNKHLWPARDALREDLKVAVNQIRAAWNAMGTAERYALPEVRQLIELLDRQFDNIPDDLREFFGLRRLKRTGEIRIDRLPVALTLYLAVYNRDGTLRQGPHGPYGTRFVLSAIGMSHSHQPNLARSQLVWHGLGKFPGSRSAYMKALRSFLAMLKADAAQQARP